MDQKCPNMHYLYNVAYFSPLGNNNFVTCYEDLSKVDSQDNPIVSFAEQNTAVFTHSYDNQNTYLEGLKNSLKDMPGYQEIHLWTVYPGLLIGTGNSHDISAKDGIAGGFEFDWVSGLPIIPGSSLKGILRSLFPDTGKKYPKELNAALNELIKEVANKKDLNPTMLREEIFNNNDIFIGGFPVIKNGNEQILAPDYITPHTKGPTKNPVPISILKVKPLIEYEFLFLLHDGLLTIQEKVDLFKELLQIRGAGGKTNVGYGQFVTEEIANSIAVSSVESIRTSGNLTAIGAKKSAKSPAHRAELKAGNSYKGTVTGYNEQKTSAKGTLDIGGSFNLFYKNVNAKPGHIDKRIPLGEIEVIYKGTDQKGYGIWRLK